MGSSSKYGGIFINYSFFKFVPRVTTNNISSSITTITTTTSPTTPSFNTPTTIATPIATATATMPIHAWGNAGVIFKTFSHHRFSLKYKMN